MFLLLQSFSLFLLSLLVPLALVWMLLNFLTGARLMVGSLIIGSALGLTVLSVVTPLLRMAVIASWNSIPLLMAKRAFSISVNIVASPPGRWRRKRMKTSLPLSP